MNRLKLLIPLISLLLNSGCASFGPTVRIETPEAVDDFVVLCSWHDDGFLNLHGGRRQTDSKAYVTSSDEELSCGVSVWGGDGSVLVMHPLYMTGYGCLGDGCKQKGNDILRMVPTTKLQYLDELKAKFEAGYWDKYKWPADQFVFSVRGVCLGTFDYYFGYYLSEVDHVDFSNFKNKYYQPILECRRKEQKFLSDNRIKDGIRKEYIDPEEILLKWWGKMEKIANEYK